MRKKEKSPRHMIKKVKILLPFTVSVLPNWRGAVNSRSLFKHPVWQRQIQLALWPLHIIFIYNIYPSEVPSICCRFYAPLWQALPTALTTQMEKKANPIYELFFFKNRCLTTHFMYLSLVAKTLDHNWPTVFCLQQ